MKSIYGERNVNGPPITFNYEEKSSDGNRLLDSTGRVFGKMQIRKIGIGSLDGGINCQMVLDAYELLDDCLRYLYDLSPVERLAMQVGVVPSTR